jgi:hypothetical protein
MVETDMAQRVAVFGLAVGAIPASSGGFVHAGRDAH